MNRATPTSSLVLRARQIAIAAALLSLSTSALGQDSPQLDCVIEPSMLVSVGSEADGVLASVNVDRGAIVEQGELLATLVDDLERASANLFKARANADVSIRLGQVRTGFGRRSAERIRRLQRASVASEQEVDQAMTDENLAQLKLEEAEVNRRLARLELGRAQAALGQRRIVSPVRALVVQRLMHPGERVSDAPILTLAAIDELHVEVIAPVDLLGRIKVGQQAMVSPEAPVGGEYPATVTVVDRVMDARSGTFGVRLVLPNPDHALPAGLRCSIEFNVSPTVASNGAPATHLEPVEKAAPSAQVERDVITEQQPEAIVAEPDTAATENEEVANVVSHSVATNATIDSTAHSKRATASQAPPAASASARKHTAEANAVEATAKATAKTTAKAVHAQSKLVAERSNNHDDASTVPPAEATASDVTTNTTDAAESLAQALLDSAIPTANAAPRPTPAPNPTRNADLATTAVACLALGSYRSRIQAESMRRLLASPQVPAKLRIERTASEAGYLLLVDARDDPQVAIRRLREKGVKDLQHLRTGALAGYVSLGYYTQEASARKGQQWFAARDIETLLHPRSQNNERYWVELLVQDERSRAQLTRRVQAIDGRITVKSDTCRTPISASS